ncbi:hypothetical protein BC833DRAFT_15677 [Globomyces pollinis-pini]|nr:hypothetical protein BC833DRAFT_15677 [Globomyces pollinis-pini]
MDPFTDLETTVKAKDFKPKFILKTPMKTSFKDLLLQAGRDFRKLIIDSPLIDFSKSEDDQQYIDLKEKESFQKSISELDMGKDSFLFDDSTKFVNEKVISGDADQSTMTSIIHNHEYKEQNYVFSENLFCDNQNRISDIRAESEFGDLMAQSNPLHDLNEDNQELFQVFGEDTSKNNHTEDVSHYTNNEGDLIDFQIDASVISPSNDEFVCSPKKLEKSDSLDTFGIERFESSSTNSNDGLQSKMQFNYGSIPLFENQDEMNIEALSVPDNIETKEMSANTMELIHQAGFENELLPNSNVSISHPSSGYFSEEEEEIESHLCDGEDEDLFNSNGDHLYSSSVDLEDITSVQVNENIHTKDIVKIAADNQQLESKVDDITKTDGNAQSPLESSWNPTNLFDADVKSEESANSIRQLLDDIETDEDNPFSINHTEKGGSRILDDFHKLKQDMDDYTGSYQENEFGQTILSDDDVCEKDFNLDDEQKLYDQNITRTIESKEKGEYQAFDVLQDLVSNVQLESQSSISLLDNSISTGLVLSNDTQTPQNHRTMNSKISDLFSPGSFFASKSCDLGQLGDEGQTNRVISSLSKEYSPLGTHLRWIKTVVLLI